MPKFDLKQITDASIKLNGSNLSEIGADLGHNQSQISNVLSGTHSGSSLTEKLADYDRKALKALFSDIFGGISNHIEQKIDQYVDDCVREHKGVPAKQEY